MMRIMRLWTMETISLLQQRKYLREIIGKIGALKVLQI